MGIRQQSSNDEWVEDIRINPKDNSMVDVTVRTIDGTSVVIHIGRRSVLDGGSQNVSFQSKDNTTLKV